MNKIAREFAESWDRDWYGFWGFENLVTGRDFVLEEHVDPTWAPSDAQKIVDYLKGADLVVAGQVPAQNCLLCGVLINDSAYRSDGKLLWPDSLAHFVEVHAVVLPTRFISHIRSENYVPKSIGDLSVANLPWPK